MFPSLLDKIKLVLEKIPEFTEHASKLTEDDKFKNILDTSGSIGGLMKLSLFVIEKVYKHLQGQEKIAFSQLLMIMINSSKESLEIIKNLDELKITDVEKNADFLNNLLSIFISTKWNRHLFDSDNPVIKKYQNEIIKILKENGIDHKLITRFSILFEDRFTNNLKKDRIKYNELNSFLEKSESKDYADELTEYLERTYNSQFFCENKIDDKFLHQYYIVNNTFEVPIKYWRKDYEEIKEKTDWNYKKFLKSTDPNDDYVILSASFGIGKSSYSRYLIWTLAEHYLKNPSDVENYIPIFIPLKDNFNNIYGKRNFDSVLNLVTNKGDDEGKKRKILCILDGLDEYKDKENIIDKISKYRSEKGYENLKFIITTRPELEYPKLLNIESEAHKFVKLERFTETQIEKFITKYGISLEYNDLSNYIDYDALSTPLFCYITISTISKNKEFLLQISKEEEVKRKFTKTTLYLYFIHSILKGRLKETVSSEDIINLYKYEKSLLRKIAALKQLTPIFKLQDIEYNLPKVGIEYKKEIIKPIFSTYFFPEGDELEERIEFLHRSFEEYLIAEYYIESILQNEPYLLNLGISDIAVSNVTLDFLYDLLDIITSLDKNEVYNLFLKSLLQDKVIDKDKTINQIIIEQLTKNAQSILETENIIGLNNIDKKENDEGFWFIKKLDKQDYNYMWNHRWISLFTLVNVYQFPADVSRINLNKDIDNFLKISSPFISYRLKNFVKCSLIGADLSGADLSGADLSGADLSGAVISDANLFGANLSGAVLFSVNLSGANLSGAVLFSVNLSGANLSGADLSGAVLSNAILSGADLSGVNLYNTILSSSDLSGADISGADICHVIIINCKYENSIGNDLTNFTEAIIDDLEFIDYIKEFTNKVPNKIENKQELKSKLEQRTIDTEIIEYLLKISKLPK